jgi:hypothetical protein
MATTTVKGFVALMEKLYNHNDSDADDDNDTTTTMTTMATTTTITADESVAIVLSAHNYYAMQGLC